MEDSKIKVNLLNQLKEQYHQLSIYLWQMDEYKNGGYLTKEHNWNDALHTAHLLSEQFQMVSETQRMLKIHGVPFHEAMSFIQQGG